MTDEDFEKLLEDTEEAIRKHGKIAILGWNNVARDLLRQIRDMHVEPPRVFDAASIAQREDRVHPMAELVNETYDYLVVTANDEKETLLHAAFPFIRGKPKILVSGYGHYEFRDADFHRIMASLREESLANGYPNTRPHLYQCLLNAARLNLQGSIAEFGAYKGGTTMFLAKVVEHLGKDWPIFAFDTFDGFPVRKHPWDMYDHEDLKTNDFATVQAYLRGKNVHLVKGDIVDTAAQLADRPMILTFMDTDNYSPAMAALDVVQDTTVVGGAIVFDHFTGTNRFRQTLGERFAAQSLLDDPRYFNLHGTGVFLRQKA